MGKYIIAHDLGTSGNKATLFSLDGRLIASSVHAYDAHFFNNNWAEQDPEDWWRAVCKTTADMAKLVPKEEILAMSFSAHTMGCLPISAEGRVLRPHILWCDMRATEQARYIAERMDAEEFYRITGHRLNASYSLPKYMWVKENEPEIYEKTAYFMHAKDYIVMRFTGRVMTDYSDASGTNAFDINTFKWSDRLLELAGIDAAKLPTPVASTTVAGNILPEAAEQCGLSTTTRIVLGAGDGATASIGAGSIDDGVTYACLGTSAWFATTTDKPMLSRKQYVVNWASAIPGKINPIGTMNAAGASFAWLKDVVCKSETEQAKAEGTSPYALINREIEEAPVGSNGIVFLPYLLGERAPRWNPDAKGAFIGIKKENDRRDLLRSVVEGIGYNLRVILDDFISNGVDPESIAVVGGLAKGDIVRRIFADIWNHEVTTLNFTEEAGSIGAAVIAGVGIGEYDSFEAVRAFWKVTSSVKPDAEAAKAYEPYVAVFDKAYDALVGVFDDLSALR